MTNDTEDNVLASCALYSDAQIHIVRDDLRHEARQWLRRRNRVATRWYLAEFATPKEADELAATDGSVSTDTLGRFVRFGFETTRGFQRQPNLSDKDYNVLTKRTGGWVAWTKEQHGKP